MVDSETREDIREMVDEDFGFGDVTSESLIPEEKRAEAEVIANQKGYLAGIPEAMTVFDELDVNAEKKYSDGDAVEQGDVLIKITGSARNIMAAERVALNLLSRMSGIATATKEMQKRAERENPDVQIAATRKTAPLLRKFDKRAVEAVGGEPHRYHLGDFVLIKDNHLALVGSVSEAVENAIEVGLSEKIEIEVTEKDEAIAAAEAGADIVMLDNFSPDRAQRTVEALEEKGLRDEAIIESSGGIDFSNVQEFAAVGVDVISSSYMTMIAPALDIKLNVTKEI